MYEKDGLYALTMGSTRPFFCSASPTENSRMKRSNWSKKPNSASLSVERLEDRTVPSLVAAYGLNEGTGTTTADASGNNTGTLSNATWSSGKFGNAVKLTGAANSE